MQCVCRLYSIVLSFFFFQAEDGIRDLTVTGVQTCALPIWARAPATGESTRISRQPIIGSSAVLTRTPAMTVPTIDPAAPSMVFFGLTEGKIGRASCREECRSRWSPYH